MLTFRKKYFIGFLLLLITEIFIALFINDSIIRPFLGDFLVVILLYCFAKTFINASSFSIAMGVLIFSFGIEILQYFKIVEVLGLQDNRFAYILIGNVFSWGDLLAYGLGVGVAYWIDEKDIF